MFRTQTHKTKGVKFLLIKERTGTPFLIQIDPKHQTQIKSAKKKRICLLQAEKVRYQCIPNCNQYYLLLFNVLLNHPPAASHI